MDEEMIEEMTEEEILLKHQKESRRQRQQLRFAEEEKKEEEEKEDDKEQKKQKKSPSNFKRFARAARLLSIADPSTQLPNAEVLRRLQQLHQQAQAKRQGSSIPDEISDELLDKLPFKIEIIPDRHDDFLTNESSISKTRRQNKQPLDIPKVIPSGLSNERRLEIIEEILKKLNDIDILDDIRRAHAVSYQLPRNNQQQKNVAERLEDLTGSDIVMLNDFGYMRNLCELLKEKHQKELEAHFHERESKEKRRCLLQSIKTYD